MKNAKISKVTKIDLANAAQVSTATVDRVLNERPGVHLRTREHVLSVAAELGYIKDGAIVENQETESRPNALTFDFMLPGLHNGFSQILIDALRAHPAIVGGSVNLRIHQLDANEPTKFASIIADVAGSSHGVAVVALDHVLVREGLLKLIGAGVPVITLASDISGIPHQGYIGSDNRMAGRLAGQLMGKFLGKGQHNVLFFTSPYAYRGHEEREMGFRHIMAEHYPQVNIVRAEDVLNDDDLDGAFRSVEKAFAALKGIDGVYCMSRGAPAVASALEKLEIARSVTFIAHELTPKTRFFLVNGTIDALIDQSATTVASNAVERLLQLNANQASKAEAPPGIPPTSLLLVNNRIIMRENMPV